MRKLREKKSFAHRSGKPGISVYFSRYLQKKKEKPHMNSQPFSFQFSHNKNMKYKVFFLRRQYTSQKHGNLVTIIYKSFITPSTNDIANMTASLYRHKNGVL
jgi:hypothetical protein